MTSVVWGPVRLDLFYPATFDQWLDCMVTLGAVNGVVQAGVMLFGFGFWLTVAEDDGQ
jgi:hypothetical protein